MVITLTDIVFVALCGVVGVQSGLVKYWRTKYQSELKKHAETAEKLAISEQHIGKHTATITLATKILDDYQKGRLQKEYKTTSDVMEAVEWPELIEVKDK